MEKKIERISRLMFNNTETSHLIINIKQLTNKIVYESLTYKHSAPSAEMKWVEYYPILEVLDWKCIYSLTSVVTKNIRLQYQIVRYFACNYNLNI